VDLDIRSDKRRPKKLADASADARKERFGSLRRMRSSAEKLPKPNSPTKEEREDMALHWNEEAQRQSNDWTKASVDLKDAKWEQVLYVSFFLTL
jgi:hypothetical protein